MSESTLTALPRLARPLGVHGWDHLDPVLLAALATASPVLLVGPHGTAKSLLVERVAKALGLAFRHYNASLLNYDDLVGIPLPAEDGSRLRFVSTPGAIWDAEFIFFDEISRCRADLQNKLFPIVHERRVAGIDLHRLQHRWAAMNPPAPINSADLTDAADIYIGSEALDPALADRFPFVLRVPSWKDLSADERADLVAGEVDEAEISDALPALVCECGRLIAALTEACDRQVGDYVVLLMDQLDASGLPQSPRRARSLARSILAVHAARIILGAPDADLEQSALLTVNSGLPQTASETSPSPAKVFAAHRQAWELSSLNKDDSWRQILTERDPVERIKKGFRLNLSQYDLGRLVTQALAAQPTDAACMALSATVFLTLGETCDLTPSAWEGALQLGRRVLEPRNEAASVAQGPHLELWREINAWLAACDLPDRQQKLAGNFLLGGFPDLWLRTDWKAEVAGFLDLVAEFGALVSEGRGKA